VTIRQNVHVFVAGVYHKKKFNAQLSSELVVLGYFNLDWLIPISDNFKNICLDLNLTQIITKPTRVKVKNLDRSSLLDFIHTNNPHKYNSVGVFASDLRYHCPIACIRNSRQHNSDPRIIRKRHFLNFSPQAFMHD
jgi:hypothetical protein